MTQVSLIVGVFALIKPNLVITAAGVGVALCIGATQVYIAFQQMKIAKRQQSISGLQGEIQAVSSWLPFVKDNDPNIRLNAITAFERSLR